MELVIKLSESAYKEMCEHGTDRVDFDIQCVIKNGVVLPKNHGRLIDADALLAEIECLKRSPWYESDINGSYVVRKDAVGMIEDLCIKKAPTVIEAESEDKE
jgi:hypothetical protein